MAGDHGVTRQGVSAYPSAVTAQMVRNFAAGGAAINALAQGVGARVVVADLGVAADLSDVPDLRHHAIAPGTRDMARGPGLLTRSSLYGYTWRFHGLSHNMRRTRNTGDHVATCYAFCLGRLP
jgi:nicotinate-nucleotide--dimethylbenzimidazole phosphoribosyltransferase